MTLSLSRFSILFGVLAMALLAACHATDDPDSAEATALYCQTLARLNSTDVNIERERQVVGHAQMLEQLLEVAPAAIKPQLQSFQELIVQWSTAGDSLLGQFTMFRELSDPQLAALQAQIADYSIDACQLDLPKGYHVHQQEDSAPICDAWPRIGSPLTNNRFPNYLDTSGGNYFVNQFWAVPIIPAPAGFIKVPMGGAVVYRGEYPHARYFAFHPNDKSTNNLPTLVDVEIEPDLGSVNPYLSAPQPGQARRFTARYVFTEAPAKPASNTRYVGVSKEGGYNPLVMSLLRLYASDLGSSANSGGVKLPSVTVYDADGNEVSYYPECDPYPAGPLTEPQETTRFPVFPLADLRATDPLSWDTYSQFNLPVDLLANADVQYLSTVLSHRFGELYVIRAQALSTPDTRAGEAVYTEGKDVRFWTVCNYNFWAGRAGTCLLDQEVALDQQGYYTLVVSAQAARPDNLAQWQATWMDWGPYLDTQISYRTGLRNNPMLRGVAGHIRGEDADSTLIPYVPVGVPCSKHRFEQAGWRGCFADAGAN